MALAYVNGNLVEEADATISVFDHGLVVGDAVFETILLHDRHPFALARHLARIERSARGLGLVPPPSSEIADAVHAVVAASALSRGRIRVTVTAGLGPLGSGRLEGPPSLIVAVGAMGDEHAAAHVAVGALAAQRAGRAVRPEDDELRRERAGARLGRGAGADEAIFANTAGALCEGTGSNVFYVLDGELVTPTLDSGCLAGVTRALVLEQDKVTERDEPAGRFTADGVLEAFLTSTLRGVQPIASIDGAALAVCPGPRTIAASEHYDAIVATTEDA